MMRLRDRRLRGKRRRRRRVRKNGNNESEWRRYMNGVDEMCRDNNSKRIIKIDLDLKGRRKGF